MYQCYSTRCAQHRVFMISVNSHETVWGIFLVNTCTWL